MSHREQLDWLHTKIKRLYEQLDEAMERYAVEFGVWEDKHDPLPVNYLGSAAIPVTTTINVAMLPGAVPSGAAGPRPIRLHANSRLGPSNALQPRPVQSQIPNRPYREPRPPPVSTNTAPAPDSDLKEGLLDTPRPGYTPAALPDAPRPKRTPPDEEPDVHPSFWYPNATESEPTRGVPIRYSLMAEYAPGSEAAERQRILREREMARVKARRKRQEEEDEKQARAETAEMAQQAEAMSRLGLESQDGSQQELQRRNQERERYDREQIRQMALEAERQRLEAEQIELQEQDARLRAEVQRREAAKAQAASRATAASSAAASRRSEQSPRSHTTGGHRSHSHTRDRSPTRPRDDSRAGRGGERSATGNSSASGSRPVASRSGASRSSTRSRDPAQAPAGVTSNAQGRRLLDEDNAGDSPRQRWLLADVRQAFRAAAPPAGPKPEDADEGLYHSYGSSVSLPRGVAAAREAESGYSTAPDAGDSVLTSRSRSQSRLSRGSDPSEKDPSSPVDSRREQCTQEEWERVGGQSPSRRPQRLTRELLAEPTTSSQNSSLVTYSGHPGSAPSAAGESVRTVRAH